LKSALSNNRAGPNVIDLNRVKSTATSAQSRPADVGNDWREQLTLKLEQLKEKNNESSSSVSATRALDFRHREFVKPGKAAAEKAASKFLGPERTEYHPLVEKALQKIDKLRATPPENLNPENPAKPATLTPEPETERPRKRKRLQGRPEPVERIEISLNQQSLPFEIFESIPSPVAEDQIQTGLSAAPIPCRVRAGIVDAIFVFGCFLIFMLIVFFVPDFVFLTNSSLVGMSGICLLILVAYVFLFTALTRQTLGMNRENLQVVTFQGNPANLRETGLRCFGYVVSLGCFLLGFLWALFDPERLTWHDKISRTFIIRSRSRFPAL
jgi:uncharacterized RDD family membrane protein YckC